MRISAALVVAVAVCVAPTVSPVLADVVVDPPVCKPSEVPKTVTENGQPVVRCVKAPTGGSPAKEFNDFIHGNRFQHGKSVYTFCLANRYMARTSGGATGSPKRSGSSARAAA